MDRKTMASFNEYIQHVVSYKKTLKKKVLDENANLELKDLKGGVNKKFDPSRGHVITMKDSARSDYTKEDNVKNVLESSPYTPAFLEAIDKNYFDYFISFQNELEEDEVPRDPFSGEVRYGRQPRDFRRVSIYENMDTEAYKQINERQQLFSCIHQLMFIHFILFINKIKHGDMHMKNIKWLKFEYHSKSENTLKTFFSVKAFDFGHAEINCSGLHGGQRYTDIRYLFKRDSQKRALAGLWEGWSRKKDYRNMDNESLDEQERIRKQTRMEKHFPLHHLIIPSNLGHSCVKKRRQIWVTKDIQKNLKTVPLNYVYNQMQIDEK